MKLTHVKKFLYSFLLFLIVTTFSFSTFATDVQVETNFEIVENNSVHVDIGDLGELEKGITDFNEKDRSATITLTIANTRKVTKKAAEIFLVIDNSLSMTENNVGNITREQAVLDSANELVDKLFENDMDLKIGVVSFSSADIESGKKEGTLDDANLLLELTDSYEDVKSSISGIADSTNGARTNIDAGITLASQKYSNNENTDRYMVLLTDGVPNNDIEGNTITYKGDVATNTKAKLQKIEESGIEVLGVMIGLDGETQEPTSKKTYRALAEEVFGTVSNPTISKYYYVSDEKDDIETTISGNIYKNILGPDLTLRNIVIKDYFPQEIIDNFDFEYIVSPDIGEVSQVVDTSDNSITWTIEKLEPEHTATLSYKLTLKSDYDSDIVDKVLPTNEKIDVTAENDDKTIKGSSDESPKVKVTEKEDDTIANADIPQTGDNLYSFGFGAILIIILVFVSARYFYLKRNTK